MSYFFVGAGSACIVVLLMFLLLWECDDSNK